MELHVPGLATLKNIKEKHMNTLCSIVLAVAMAGLAYFSWSHDAQSAQERKSIATQITKSNEAVEKALSALTAQSRLQTCIHFLSLPVEMQQRIKIANPKVCESQ